MRIAVRDTTGAVQVGEVQAGNIYDARNRALIDGVVVQRVVAVGDDDTIVRDEWLNPAHIVSIAEAPDA